MSIFLIIISYALRLSHFNTQTMSVSKQLFKVKEAQRNNQESQNPPSVGFREERSTSGSLCVSAGNPAAVDTRSIKRLIFLLFCSCFQLWCLWAISQWEAVGQRDGLGHLRPVRSSPVTGPQAIHTPTHTHIPAEMKLINQTHLSTSHVQKDTHTLHEVTIELQMDPHLTNNAFPWISQ